MLLKRNKHDPMIPATIIDHLSPWSMQAIHIMVNTKHVISACISITVKVAKTAKKRIAINLILSCAFLVGQTIVENTRQRIINNE